MKVKCCLTPQLSCERSSPPSVYHSPLLEPSSHETSMIRALVGFNAPLDSGHVWLALRRPAHERVGGDPADGDEPEPQDELQQEAEVVQAPAAMEYGRQEAGHDVERRGAREVGR